MKLLTFLGCAILYFSTSLISQGNGEKILFLFPFASKSHTNVFQPLVQGLADRGHDLTVLTPVKPSKTHPKITTHTFLTVKDMMGSMESPFEMRRKGPLALLSAMDPDKLIHICRDIYRNPEFQEILQQKFDLVLMSGFMNNCLDGAIYKLQAPHALITTVAPPALVTQVTGNHLPSSFVPFMLFGFTDRMSFFERLLNFSASLLFTGFFRFYMNPKYEAMYKEELGLGPNGPGFDEIHNNVSLVLMNSHFSLTFPRPNLPDNVEVGGMHCRASRPLPKDLEDFISGAEHGFIYFSLGSIVQAKEMPEEYRKVFVKVFGKLKERVIWKWETEEMDDLPSNVKLSKWCPQQDLLGHPKIKLFITHGGLLSTQESVYHGVPLLGIPIFGDQDLNMKQAESQGYALTIEILGLSEKDLEEKLTRMLTEPSFSSRARDLSSIFRDQTETPLERAVYWSEYVMRHKGAPHLRSGARELNYFQIHSYDVIGFLALVISLFLWLLKTIICIIIRVVKSLCASNNSKQNKSSKKSSSKKKNN